MFLKVVLFWLQGCGHPYKGGTPYVATDSKPLILGLSFVSKLSLKGGQTTQNTFPKICCTKIPVHQCKHFAVPSHPVFFLRNKSMAPKVILKQMKLALV